VIGSRSAFGTSPHEGLDPPLRHLLLTSASLARFLCQSALWSDRDPAIALPWLDGGHLIRVEGKRVGLSLTQLLQQLCIGTVLGYVARSR
jgi:hypothetical protein